MNTLERLYQRLMYTIGRGRVNLVDDGGQVQLGQIDFGPIGGGPGPALKDNTPLLGIFGHVSNPPIGSDVVAIFVGGDRTNGVVVASGHQAHRLKGLAPGDSGIHDVRGAYVWLTANGLVIDGAGLPMTIQNVGTLTIHGDLKVTGDILDQSGSNTATVKALRTAYDAHKHTGVTACAASTGTTDHSV